MVASRPVTRKIPLWKLVGGAAVHFIVSAYVLALGLDGWRFAMASSGGVEAWLAHVPWISLKFLGAYGALGAGATVLAALAEPFAPRGKVEEGETLAATHLARALAQGRGVFGVQADAALERIAALRPDMGDDAVRAMLRDLGAMVEAGRAAMPDPAIAAMTTAAIERIAGELDTLARNKGEQAQDKARIMATYVQKRYGQDGIQ